MDLYLKNIPDIIQTQKDIDTVSGLILPDQIIEQGYYSTSPWTHGYNIRTNLPDKLLPTATIKSLITSLSQINKILQEESNNSKELMSILFKSRAYINLYFNSIQQQPVFIKSFDASKINGENIQKYSKEIIDTLGCTRDYFRIDAPEMIKEITTTSLILREIIVHTIGLQQLAHYPGQVKNVIDNYSLKGFILDSHYKQLESGHIIDLRAGKSGKSSIIELSGITHTS